MIRKVRGECKCLKQMAGGARGLISASHLTSSDDLGAHMFTTTLSFSVSRYFYNYFHEFHLPFNIDWQRRLFARRGYSRHIGLDKRVTELLAIISENAKAGEILSMIAPGSDVALQKNQMMQTQISRWTIVSFAGGYVGSFSYFLGRGRLRGRGKLRILTN